jgi:ABC-2 type transport system ATP-binding protein
MQDMRDMILSFVDEGRTVVLSSHLLDEVERTCNAVAIVDRGNVIRQGAISDLLAGTALVLEVGTTEPERAHVLVEGSTIAATLGAVVDADSDGLRITLPAGTSHDVAAEINRVLVEGGVAVYRLQPVQTSLESWFLQVTSRLGAPE